MKPEMVFSIYPELKEVLTFASIERSFFRRVVSIQDNDLLLKIENLFKKQSEDTPASFIHFEDKFRANLDDDYDKDTAIFLTSKGHSEILRKQIIGHIQNT